MDDGFGGFGGNDDIDQGFGGFGDVEEPPKPTVPVPRRKASQRSMGLYAKSPMQKRQEEAAAQEYQDMLAREQQRQADLLDGFGTDDSQHEASPVPTPHKPNMWGQPSAPNGIVIPPFVPRDQRNNKVWDKGKMKKSQSDKLVLAGGQGDFLIRETMKGDRHVVCVHDGGNVFEQFIRHQEDKFVFMSRQFNDLSELVKFLQRNALYNKAGLPLYVDKPITGEAG